MSNGTNIRVCDEVHSNLVEHLKDTDRKIGKWTEAAIKEKIEKEKKGETKKTRGR